MEIKNLDERQDLPLSFNIGNKAVKMAPLSG
jgi:hypothetical protein